MKILSIVTLAFVIVVGINSVLVEAVQFDLAAAVFGSKEVMLAPLVYLLVCLLLLWQITSLLRAGTAGGTSAQASR